MKTEPTQPDEQMFLRLDIHQLSRNIQKNNHNVKDFVAHKNSLKIKRQSLNNKQHSNRLNTQPINQLYADKSTIHQETYSKVFNRHMNKKQFNLKDKMALTGSLKYRRSGFSLSKAQTQELPFEQKEQIAKTKYIEVEKKHNIGPLKKRMLESWLDNILMETSKLEVIDNTIGNPALKKFKVDQNSLLSRGVKPENIDRIYNSLFVHSIGFNNSLKQLSNGNDELLKNLWKVFSILLEYCAQGKYQTLIGKIQRDKQLKVSELQDQIIRRQQVIEKNQQMNEIKNIQIYKEVKQLRQDNTTLKDQKDILYEDYQKTEQAFNEQVILRLKFENKINQLFGAHRELGTKHQRLFQDYKKKIIEWDASNQKNTKLIQQNWELKVKNNDLNMEKSTLTKTNRYNQELISQLKSDKLKLGDELNSYKKYYDDQRRINKQHKRRITQYEIQLKNLTEIVVIKDKSWKQTHSQYQLSLQQNNRLYNVINEQRSRLEQLLLQKKQFNNKIMGLMSDASFQKKKRQQFTKLYYEADSQKKTALQKLSDKEVELAIAFKRIRSLEEDLSQNSSSIKQMHRVNQQLDDELQYLRKFKQSLDVIFKNKDEYIRQLQEKNQIKDQEICSLNILVTRTQTNMKNSTQLYTSEINSLKTQNQKIRAQRQQLVSTGDQKSNVLIKLKLQLQKYTDLYKKMHQNFKNQRFERINLKQNYDQSLTIISKKNQKQKSMSQQISEHKQNILQLKHQINRLSLALQNQTNFRIKREHQLNDIKRQYQMYQQQKSGCVHPFLHEDVCQSYLILKQKYRMGQNKIQQLQNEIKQTIEEYQQKISTEKQYYEKKLGTEDQKYTKCLQGKQNQLEYEKEQTKLLTQKLQKLQLLADTYNKKIMQRTNQEQNKIYSEIIEKKTEQIQKLLQKLYMQNSKAQKLQQQLNETQQKLTSQIIELHHKHLQENNRRQQKISDLEFQVQYVKQQNNKYKQQISNQQKIIEERVKQQMKEYYMIKQQNYPSQTNHEHQKYKNSPSQNQEIMKSTTNKWNKLKKIQQTNPQIKIRNDMARKIKIAYNHYKH